MAEKTKLFPGKGLFLAVQTEDGGLVRLVFSIDVADKALSFVDAVALMRMISACAGQKFELVLTGFRDRTELKDALGDELDAAIEGDGVPEVIGVATLIKAPAPAHATTTRASTPAPAQASASAGVP